MPMCRCSRSLALAAAITLVGCAPAIGSQDGDVVDGQADRRVRAVGYLIRDDDEVPYCTATLVASDVAVTAAHCLDQQDGKPLAFGLGTVDVGERIAVTAGLSHPVWDPGKAAANSGPREWLHDVAVLRLAAPVAGVTPLEVGESAAPRCGATAMGYGRDTAGGPEVTEGYDGERRSTTMCVDAVAHGMIFAHGTNGGLCWGDSGGPLLEGWPPAVSGVLHGFAGEETPTCAPGNPVAYTSLAAERAFVDCARTRGLGASPTPFVDVACHFVEPFLAALGSRVAVAPYPDGTFRPGLAISRRDFAAIVALALAPKPHRPAQDFVDVIAGASGSAALDLAYRAGFLEPVAPGKLAPNAPLLRLDLLRGVVRGLALEPGDPGKLAPFADAVEVTAEARGEVAAALGSGLVVVYPERDRLRPNAAATRAEAYATTVQALVHVGALAKVESAVVAQP